MAEAWLDDTQWVSKLRPNQGGWKDDTDGEAGGRGIDRTWSMLDMKVYVRKFINRSFFHDVSLWKSHPIFPNNKFFQIWTQLSPIRFLLCARYRAPTFLCKLDCLPPIFRSHVTEFCKHCSKMSVFSPPLRGFPSHIHTKAGAWLGIRIARWSVGPSESQRTRAFF